MVGCDMCTHLWSSIQLQYTKTNIVYFIFRHVKDVKPGRAVRQRYLQNVHHAINFLTFYNYRLQSHSNFWQYYKLLTCSCLAAR